MDFRHMAWLMDHVPYPNADRLREAVGRGRIALDLAGGTGRIARRIRSDFTDVVLVDVERRMLARGRRQGFNAVQADATRLPFRDACVDVAMFVDALHHIPAADAALDEAARVIAPAGRLYVEELDVEASWQARAVRAIERLARFGSRFHAPEALRAAVARRGLEVEVLRHSRRDYAVLGRRVAQAHTQNG